MYILLLVLFIVLGVNSSKEVEDVDGIIKVRNSEETECMPDV